MYLQTRPLTKNDLRKACLLSEEELIVILMGLGAQVQISLRTDGVPQRFQAFWPSGEKTVMGWV